MIGTSKPLRFAGSKRICSCEHNPGNERPGSFHCRASRANPPKTYRAIVRLLAEPDAKIEHIAQRHRVSTHRVRAIRAREAVAIAERKQRRVSIFGNVAEIAAERMEELAGGASLRDAGVTAGIATDKLMPLLGEAAAGVPVHINLNVGAAALHKRYLEMVEEIEGRSGENKEALPNGETMGLPSGKELPKSEEVSPST